MTTNLPIHEAANGHTNGTAEAKASTNSSVKTGLARMLKGGVIMDVVNAEQVLAHPPPALDSPPRSCPWLCPPTTPNVPHLG